MVRAPPSRYSGEELTIDTQGGNADRYSTREDNRADTRLMSLRVQFPSDQPVYGSDKENISYTNNGVNRNGAPFKEILEDDRRLKLPVYEDAQGDSGLEADSETKDKIRYSLNEDFPEQFDQWLAETDERDRITELGYFNIGSTSIPLKKIGSAGRKYILA